MATDSDFYILNLRGKSGFMFSRLSPTLILGLVTIFVIFAIYFRQASPAVELEIGVPVRHEMIARDGMIMLPVVLRLSNHTDKQVVLSAPNACKIFRYVILRDDGVFVQGQGKAPAHCSPAKVSDAIGAGEVVERIEQIALNATRYRAGDYVAHIEFWGYEAKGTFRLIAP